MQKYVDYRLALVGDGWVRARYSPIGSDSESASRGKLNFDSLREASYWAQRLKDAVLTPTELIGFGEHLWDSLFSSDVRSHFSELFRDIQKTRDWGIRIKLEFDETISPQEAFLPWEYMRYPGDAYSQAFWFATHPKLVISRYRPLYEVANAITLRSDEKLRLLLAVSNPKELNTIVYEPVWDTIKQLPQKQSNFSHPELITQLSAKKLDEKLREYQPHIVHILAHGRFTSDGEIAFLGEDNHLKWYKAWDLASLFEVWSPGMVLLHACEGAQTSIDDAFVGLASRIVQGNIPVVLAMRYPVTNKTAVAFSQEFYNALGKGEPVDGAVQWGRRSIGRDYGYEMKDFGTPTLFMRVQDGKFISSDKFFVSSRHNNLVTDNYFVEPENTFHNLPQKGYSRFIGRQDQLLRIRELLSPKSGCNIIGITGTAGVGKTSLALEAAFQVLNNDDQPDIEKFGAIVWATAQTAVLTASGLKQAKKPINTLEDIYTIIAITLRKQEILKSAQDEQDELIRQALIERRTLLIVDNFETVDDDRIFSFLQTLPPPTKVVITSRFSIDAPGIIELNELSREDGILFLDIESNRRTINISIEQKDLLFDACSGLPLVMVWSLAQIKFGYTVEATLKLLEDAKGEVVQFLFGRALEIVKNQDAFIILLSIALFTADASRTGISAVSGFDDFLQRDKGLALLNQLGLVDQTNERFKILPITKRLIESDIDSSNRDFVEKARKRQIQYYLDFMKKFNPKQEPTPPVEPFWEEIENIRGLIRWCYSSDSYSALIGLSCSYAPFIWTHGLYQELFELTDWTSNASKITESWDTLAEINLHAILAFMDQNQPDKMISGLSVVEMAFSRMSKIPDDLKETYLFTRASAAGLKRDPKYVEYFEEDLELTRKMGVRWREAGTLYWMGTIAYNNNNWEEANTFFKKAVHIAESQDDKRTMALPYGFMVEILYYLGDVNGAYKLYETVFDFVETYGQFVSKGHLSYGIAKVMTETGRLKEALVQAQRAMKIYGELKRSEGVEKSKALIIQIQEKLIEKL